MSVPEFLTIPYTVIYLLPGNPFWKFYECEAEDGDDAEAKCQGAYPDGEVLWVNEGHGSDSQHMGSMEDDEPFDDDRFADSDALASAGFGTDEDYGCFNSGDDY